MRAEIRILNVTALPYTARFGLGSNVPVKRWARFVLKESGDLYWTRAIDIRKDIDSGNIHISIHKSGDIFSSRYIATGEQKVRVYSCKVGNVGSAFREITKPHEVECGNELLESSYLYYGLPTLTEKDKKTDVQSDFVPCLDEQLVNSRLYYSLDLAPWTGEDKITAYLVAKQNRVLDKNDPRCHVFIFCWGNVSAVVTMRFTDGNGQIDINQTAKADKNTKPLKRLFCHETLKLSEHARLEVTPYKPFPDT